MQEGRKDCYYFERGESHLLENIYDYNLAVCFISRISCACRITNSMPIDRPNSYRGTHRPTVPLMRLISYAISHDDEDSMPLSHLRDVQHPRVGSVHEAKSSEWYASDNIPRFESGRPDS